MPRHRAHFWAGLAAGAILAGSAAFAQSAVTLIRGETYGLIIGNTATIYCTLANGQPRRGSEPTVQQTPATIGGVPMRQIHVTCFN
ncbi:hypothetical protein [Roseococcus sp. YIM B11640]|uniref:hypothetical protein n=1 Tax=Roseococcus sp. YIM B11640 TaxID=3133973 RepID=UPI003C7996DD